MQIAQLVLGHCWASFPPFNLFLSLTSYPPTVGGRFLRASQTSTEEHISTSLRIHICTQNIY